MIQQLHVLQANLCKSRETQLSLLNDEGLQDFGLLLIQEPHCVEVNGQIVTAPRHHPYRTTYTPTLHHAHGRWPFRSMIWAHHDTPVRPLPVASSDITAVLMSIGGRHILVFSIYVPRREDGPDNPLLGHLRQIHDTVQQTQRDLVPAALDVMIGGDFNRHDPLWCGSQPISSHRQGEGQPILELMADLDLHNLLPRGIITYESGGHASTIDLALASDNLAGNVVQCEPYSQECRAYQRISPRRSTA